MNPSSGFDPASLLLDIKRWGADLGFARIGVANIDLSVDEAHFIDWLRAGFAGEMRYMSRHGSKRSRPAELLPGTVSCISARMDYWPAEAADAQPVLADGGVAYISRYALGRDYHKLMRSRLQKLCNRIGERVGPFGYRAFADSAPVLEKALARNAGLGLDRQTHEFDRSRCGFVFLPRRDLPRSGFAERSSEHRPLRHLQRLHAGMPHRCDRRALSPRRSPLHFISHHRTQGLRYRSSFGGPSAIGSTDATTVSWCVRGTSLRAPRPRRTFAVRHGLDRAQLIELFSWSEAQFLDKTRGSAIRRIGWSAGCATWQSRSATRRVRPAWSDALRQREHDELAVGARARALGARAAPRRRPRPIGA